MAGISLKGLKQKTAPLARLVQQRIPERSQSKMTMNRQIKWKRNCDVPSRKERILATEIGHQSLSAHPRKTKKESASAVN